MIERIVCGEFTSIELRFILRVIYNKSLAILGAKTGKWLHIETVSNHLDRAVRNIAKLFNYSLNHAKPIVPSPAWRVTAEDNGPINTL
jgi:hypothetical protein